MQLRALVRGNQAPLQPPVNDIDGVCSKTEKEAVDQRLRYSFVGGPALLGQPIVLFGQDAGRRNHGCLAHIRPCRKAALL